MSQTLRAGPLRVEYADGELRRVRAGAVEVLRRVHAPVRDRNWGTIPYRLEREEIRDDGDSFCVEFSALHEEGDVRFGWNGTIVGEPNGTISFSFEGEAQTSFWRNRIGFCVLHPMSCAGNAARVEHLDGSRAQTSFPRLIAPHCPFQGLGTLAHEAAPGCWAKVTFEGDEFETEDQRNWTDASFKTYCTPLRLPFPVWIEAGTRVSQRVTLSLQGDWSSLDQPAKNSAPVRIQLGERGGVLPPIGLLLSPRFDGYSPREADLLRALAPAHLRVDLHLGRAFQEPLARAVAAARTLGCALEVGLFLGDHASGDELDTLIEALRDTPISAFIAFKSRTQTVEAAPFAALKARLNAGFPGVPVGAGSNANFAELNRQNPPADADFVVYASNPQVHAFDDASILETPPSLGQTLQSARAIAGGRGVKVSSLSLRPLFNAVATQAQGDDEESEAHPPANADPRQFSPLAATWLGASLAALVGAGLGSQTHDSLTALEPVGWRGLLDRDGQPSPSFFALREWNARRGQPTFGARSSDEERLLAMGVGESVWLFNLTDQPLRVEVEGHGPVELSGYEVRFVGLP